MRQQFSTALQVLAAASLWAMLATPAAAADEPPRLVDNPPSNYTVQKGDTLWAISGRFLRDPWRWPDVWRMNRDQIRNPHRIYPGDVIVLEMTADGTPRLAMQPRAGGPGGQARLSPSTRVTALDAEAIPSIPPGDIEPFLAKPLITGSEGLVGSAEIVAGRDRDRVVRAQNDRVYAVGVDRKRGDAWYIYRPGKALVSLDTGEILGYENRYMGSVKVDRFGDVSTLTITEAIEEIFVGDRLVPIPPEVLVNFVPHAPTNDLRGRIIASYRNASEMGRGNIVTLDKGTQDGVDVGTVMAVYKGVPPILDPRPSTDVPRMLRFLDQTTVFVPDRYLNVPEERVGLVFVFRTFDRVSYGLLLNTTDPVTVGDFVRKP
jgi:hypothetical protein